MSDIDKVVIGTRRRLLSGDYNNGQRLRDRIDLELVSAQALGDVYKAFAAGIGGVIGGLEVRAISGTNTVEVQPGIALVPSTPADTLYDPPVNIIELRTPTVVDLGPFVDGGNPRLVTIEIQATQVAKVNAPVDVFDPGTGTFTVANQDVVTGSTPTISVRAGAAAPSPQVAAGPGVDGFLPLAVVKLATAQASFTDDFVPVLMCRPLLAALGGTICSPRDIVGAGVSVGEEAGGAFGALQLLEVHDTDLALRGIPARIRGWVSFAGTVTARTPNTTTPAALLASTGPVYGYAVHPPWLNDYGAIAPREARVENPNQVSLVATADSVVFGDGSTFISLGLGTAGDAGPTFRNGFVIWDDLPPGGIENGPVGTAPPRVVDKRGPSTGSLTLDATQDPSWGNVQSVVESAYIGAASATGGQFVAQSYRGAGRVVYVDELDIPAGTGARPIRREVADVGASTFRPGAYPNMDQGGGEIDVLPDVALTADLGLVFDGGAAGAVVAALVYGQFGQGQPDQTVGLGGYRQRLDNTAQPAYADDARFEIELGTSRDANLALTLTAGGATAILWLAGYQDALLGAR